MSSTSQWLTLCVVTASMTTAFAADQPGFRVVANPDGRTDAVLVSRVPGLIYTSQVFSADQDGVKEQTKAILTELEKRIEASGGDTQRVARLNVAAVSEQAVNGCLEAIHAHYPEGGAPAVSFVVSRLPVSAALVGIDAVAVAKESSKTVSIRAEETGWPTASQPRGPRAYISGQAEKADNPAEAAKKTIASLVETMKFLGAKPSDAVQAKCFLKPIDAVPEVVKEFDKVFGPNKIALVFVEWDSSLPIEIELICSCPAGKDSPEYLTPPGITASPVFARVVRTDGQYTIFTRMIVSEKEGDGATQVQSVFGQLNAILSKCGSNLEHLIKATYYVADNDVSQKLNQFRPVYYNPERPPAASKAVIAGVGINGRTLGVDMIAEGIKPDGQNDR